MINQQPRPKAEFAGYPGYDLIDPRNPDGSKIVGLVYEWNERYIDASWCLQLGIEFQCPEMQFPKPRLRCLGQSEDGVRFYETSFTHPFWEKAFGVEVPWHGYVKAVGGHTEVFIEGQTYSYEAVQEFSERLYCFDRVSAHPKGLEAVSIEAEQPKHSL